MADDLFAALERSMHEPARLAILTHLSGSTEGLSFTELKALCGLTDGNLNRHLHVLADEKLVHTERTAAGRKGRTTVTLTEHGRERFLAYLAGLERVLDNARERAQSISSETATGGLGANPASA